MMPREDVLARLRCVPAIPIDFNGDATQAIGIDLPIAVINLAHRTDKWDAISHRMAAIGLNKLIRVPAVEGGRLSLAAISSLLGQTAELIEAPPRSHYTMTRPAVGCFLSHLAVWQWMIAQNLPRVLVFEDDAIPAANFDPGRFRTILGGRSNDSGLLFLGCIIMNGMAEKPMGGEPARLYYFNGTFAYLITPAACRTLISSLLPMDGHIDHQISKVLIDQRHTFAARYAAPAFFEPDWSLGSDCYVPLKEETEADRELGALLDGRRHELAVEGRPLLPPHV